MYGLTPYRGFESLSLRQILLSDPVRSRVPRGRAQSSSTSARPLQGDAGRGARSDRAEEARARRGGAPADRTPAGMSGNALPPVSRIVPCHFRQRSDRPVKRKAPPKRAYLEGCETDQASSDSGNPVPSMITVLLATIHSIASAAAISSAVSSVTVAHPSTSFTRSTIDGGTVTGLGKILVTKTPRVMRARAAVGLAMGREPMPLLPGRRSLSEYRILRIPRVYPLP